MIFGKRKKENYEVKSNDPKEKYSTRMKNWAGHYIFYDHGTDSEAIHMTYGMFSGIVSGLVLSPFFLGIPIGVGVYAGSRIMYRCIYDYNCKYQYRTAKKEMERAKKENFPKEKLIQLEKKMKWEKKEAEWMINPDYSADFKKYLKETA